MRTHGMGLLAEMMDFEPGNEETVRAWFDEVHFGEHLSVPGLCGAARYEAIKGAPKFLNLYEAEDAHVFYSKAFREIVELPSERDGEMEKIMTAKVRLICTQFYPGLPPNPPACPTVEVAGLPPTVQFGRIFVPPEWKTDFNAWYSQERTPLVEKVPGVRRVRRYMPIEGDEVMVVLYELDDEAVIERAEWKEIMSTPWTNKVRGYYRQAEGSPGVYQRRGFAF
ncbi:hypothetical protein ACFLQ0_02505 [Nitrospinota bacterium]